MIDKAERRCRSALRARSSRFGGEPRRELRGSTVGSCIARDLARMLRALDVKVVAANRSDSAFDDLVDARFGLDKVPQMLAQCDFVVRRP